MTRWISYISLTSSINVWLNIICTSVWQESDEDDDGADDDEDDEDDEESQASENRVVLDKITEEKFKAYLRTPEGQAAMEVKYMQWSLAYSSLNIVWTGWTSKSE